MLGGTGGDRISTTPSPPVRHVDTGGVSTPGAGTPTAPLGREDAVAKVKELTEGYGADVYIECTGHPSAVSQGLNLLRKLGTFVEYSVFGSDVTVDWSIISDDKELDVRGAHLGPHTWPAAIKMIESGKLPLDRICTDQFPLEKYQDALDLVGDSGGASVKVSIVHG